MWAAARKCGIPPLDSGPVSVRVVWFAPDARRRDVDSLATFAKAFLDALCKMGIISDDNSSIVVELKLGPIFISRENPRVEAHVRIVETGGSLQDC